MATEGAHRKGKGRAPRSRAERVVHDVLEATIDELARVGYARLSVEEVAARAGVNKTTVYRRWIVKPELVRAALLRFTEKVVTPDTGTLRSDLLALAGSGLALIATRRGRGLLRTMLAEGITPELQTISRAAHKTQDAQYDLILRRALGRGELPRNTDVEIVADTIKGTLSHRLLLQKSTLNLRYVERVVDLVLAGAQVRFAAAAPARGRASR